MTPKKAQKLLHNLHTNLYFMKFADSQIVYIESKPNSLGHWSYKALKDFAKPKAQSK